MTPAADGLSSLHSPVHTNAHTHTHSSDNHSYELTFSFSFKAIISAVTNPMNPMTMKTTPTAAANCKRNPCSSQSTRTAAGMTSTVPTLGGRREWEREWVRESGQQGWMVRCSVSMSAVKMMGFSQLSPRDLKYLVKSLHDNSLVFLVP